MAEAHSHELTDSHNAAAIFLARASRGDLCNRPRCMVPGPDGGWLPVTWDEMAQRILRIAAFLMDRGVDRDTKVAVLSATRLEWGLSGLALLAARGVLVPVYPSLLGDSLTHILSHSDARVLFVENAEQLERVLRVWDALAIDTLITFESIDPGRIALAAGLDDDQITALTFSLREVEALGQGLLEGAPEAVQTRLSSIRLDDIGFLIYTSGTTGLPKGVLLSHRNVGVSGDDWVALNGPLLHEGDLDILWLPMSHIFGWGQFCLGNQLGFLTYFSEPAKALGHMTGLSPHIFMSVPAYWEKLAQMARSGATNDQDAHARLRRLTGGRLSFCLSGGAGLDRGVKEFFKAAGIMIIEGYGLTECSPTLTMNRIDDYDFDSVGKPFPRVELELAEDGEILAKGDNIFRGYFKDAAATAAMFDENGWFQTGDIGRFNGDGFLKIVGRKKDILVTAGGKNIPPENIELRFQRVTLISRVIVYGDGMKYLTALIDIDDEAAQARLTEAGAEPGPAPRQHPSVRQWVGQEVEAVNRELASYETIKGFLIADAPLTVEGGFLTPSLKVKRAKVYERYGEQLRSLY